MCKKGHYFIKRYILEVMHGEKCFIILAKKKKKCAFFWRIFLSLMLSTCVNYSPDLYTPRSTRDGILNVEYKLLLYTTRQNDNLTVKFIII